MEDKLLEPTCATNPIVFLDISIDAELAGRVIIELRKDVVPKTAENFRALCTGERGVGQLGKPLHYKGVRFHKITRVYVVQTGDVVNNDGSSGESIYGPKFEDENFTLQHDDGVVSMANYGEPNSNNSQFVITSVACENLNGTNVVVGKVLRGMGIISDMEQSASDDGTPTQEIVISNCGEIPAGGDWGIADCDETEDKLPPYAQDWCDKLKEFTCDEIMNILMTIRNAGNHFFVKQRYQEARHKYRKANRYYTLLRKRFEWQEKNGEEPGDELKQLDAFAVVNNVNMAAAELKLGDYDGAKYASSEAIRLDPTCSKAFYRRGLAEISLQNFEDAINDLKEAHQLMPENKQVLNEFNRAKKLLADYNRRQMNALKSLFQ